MAPESSCVDSEVTTSLSVEPATVRNHRFCLSLCSLEDYNHGTIDGSIADQWAYSGSDAHMQWYLVPEGGGYYKIVNGYSGKPLDDYNNSTANGAEVDQWEWSGGSNQLWTITSVGGHYEILNKVSGKALEVYQSSTANGGTVDQWTYSGGNNQLWSITAS